MLSMPFVTFYNIFDLKWPFQQTFILLGVSLLLSSNLGIHIHDRNSWEQHYPD